MLTSPRFAGQNLAGTDVDGVVDRGERVETIAGSSGSSGFSLDVSGGGLTLHVSGSGSHGQSEREVKVDGVRTEYRYGRHSSSHHHMSLDFEYADQFGRRTATIGHPVEIDGVTVRHRTETVYDTEGRVEIERVGIRPFTDGTTPHDYSDAREATYEYDEAGRVTKTTFDDGTFVTVAYDAFGRKASETNQLGLIRTFIYDEQGRQKTVALPDLDGDPLTTGDVAVYEYGYDAFGNQTSIVDPLDRETRFTFDARGNQLTRTLPLGFGEDGIRGTPDDLIETGFTEEFRYDDRGRTKLHVSFNGVLDGQGNAEQLRQSRVLPPKS